MEGTYLFKKNPQCLFIGTADIYIIPFTFTGRKILETTFCESIGAGCYFLMSCAFRLFFPQKNLH